jgi:protein dithiol:quinone oxidoreductase
MSQRLAYILCFITIAILLASGFYLEYVEGIAACPLCTLQRVCFALTGLLFFIGIFLYRCRLARVAINMFAALFALSGALLAGRQIWIQFFPSVNTGECGVSLSYMLSVMPVSEVAIKVFAGGTECTQRGWEFLKLNLPEWSLLFFLAFIVMTLYYLVRECKNCNQ